MKSKIFFIVLVIFNLCALPRLALAHATPLLYEPAASSHLTTVPSTVGITFSEKIEPRASVIKVFAPDGKDSTAESTHVDRQDPHRLSVAIHPAGDGSYTVSWEVISADDGHFTKGAFAFSVGPITRVTSTSASSITKPDFTIQHSSDFTEAATIALELFGQALLLGGFVVLVFIWRPIKKRYTATLDRSHVAAFTSRFQILVITAVLFIVAGTLSYLVLKSATLANNTSTSFVSALHIFISTVSARYAIYRLIDALIILIIFVFYNKKIYQLGQHNLVNIIVYALLICAIVLRVRVSHAAASSFHPILSVIINSLHLLFKNIWTGSLAAFIFLLSPIYRKTKNATLIANALTQFSKIASVCFGVVGATGVYIIWLDLKTPANLLMTSWGLWFAILSIFTAILIGLRLYQQLVLERRLEAQLTVGRDKHLDALLEKISITLPFEMYIGMAILFVTSVLIITTPPLNHYHSFVRQTDSQGLHMQLAEHPYEDGQFLITITEARGQSKHAIQNITVTAIEDQDNIGPITIPVEQRFDGGYVFSEHTLSLPGIWHITINAHQDNAYDAIAQFTINYPQEILYDHAHRNTRHLDIFALTSIILAIGAGISGFILYAISAHLSQRIEHITRTVTTTNPSLHMTGSWFIPLVVILILIHGLSGNHTNHSGLLRSSFQKLCQARGNTWDERPPERNSIVTTPIATNGCTVMYNHQTFHFADQREYIYFTDRI